MTSELFPSVNAVILITAVLVPALGWFGFYQVSKNTLPQKEHISLSTLIGVILVGWLFLVMVLGMNNFFHPIRGRSLFPPVPNIVLAAVPFIIGLVLLRFSPTFSKVIDAMPQPWLIGIQVFRVIGGIFLILASQHLLPDTFAMPAGWGDVFTGLLAFIAVYAYLSQRLGGNWLVLGWNLFGLGDLIVALTLGFLTSPGPFQQLATEFSFTEFGQMGAFPLVLIPTSLVPFFIVLHIYSLRLLAKAA